MKISWLNIANKDFVPFTYLLSLFFLTRWHFFFKIYLHFLTFVILERRQRYYYLKKTLKIIILFFF